jgi:acetyl-CoA C-acetyltransferase
VLNKIWDPTYEPQLPLGTITMLGMSAIRYMDRYGMTEEDMARVTVKNRRQASLNPNAHLRNSSASMMCSRRAASPGRSN